MSQADAILDYLQRGHSITPLEAFSLFGTLALHSRCAELRERGHLIECELVAVGRKKVGRYSLLRIAHG